MHVLGLADNAELSHALVGGDDDLHSRPARLHEASTGVGVSGPARAEERLVILRRHRPG